MTGSERQRRAGLGALALGLICLLSAPRAQGPTPLKAVAPPAVPMLWRLERQGAECRPSYILGTMASPEASGLVQHPNVLAAWNATDALLTELLADEPGPPWQTIRLEGRNRLTGMLPKGTLAKLNEVLNGFSKPTRAQALKRVKPGILAELLPVYEHEIAPKEHQLEVLLRERSVAAGKQVGSLDSWITQVETLTSCPLDEGFGMLERSCDDILRDRQTCETVRDRRLSAYHRGDFAQLERTIASQYVTGHPSDALRMEDLLTSRVRRIEGRTTEWLERHTGQSALFAMDAAYLPGEEGLIQLMRKKGYTVTRVPDDLARAEAAVAWAEYDLAVARYELARLKAKQPVKK